MVLLTNDKKLQEIKGVLSIPIFTIKEIKQFLTATTTTSENSPELSVGPSEKIVKITIVNDMMNSSIQDTSEIINKDEQITDINVCKYQFTEVSVNKEATPDLHRKEDIQSQPVSTKTTVDAAVQTESPTETALQIDHSTTTTISPPVPPPPPPTPSTPSTPTNVKKSTSVTVLSLDTQKSTITPQCDATLKKEMRLIRSKSHQPTISNNNDARNSNPEKKQFKWRKRRNASKTYENIPQCLAIHNSHRDSNGNLNAGANSAQSSERNQSIQIIEPINQVINTSCTDITEDSETSSIVHRNINEKVIEETSTSGVISNTTSHADSECESVKQNEVTFNDEKMRENIMFDVIDRSMEQSLRMRSDEWVSRFVQIMEEALTQLLQRNYQTLQGLLFPPWTLNEATHCIKTMFRGNRDVVNASNRLLNVLDAVSTGGRINMNVKPSDYMEMYSYGVYLIDILQSTSFNCEDLQTASDSLSNLLDDIRNPNLDVHNVTFGDDAHLESHKQAPSMEIQDVTDQAIIGVEAHSGSQSKQLLNVFPTYNLRSQNKKAQQKINQQNKVSPKKSEEVSFIRNIDIKSNFFASLDLQKRKSESVSNNINRQTCEVQTNEFNTQHRSGSVNGHPKDKFGTIEPKMVRKFNKCPEFEEKLRNKSREILDMDQLDYSEDIEENYHYMGNDYYSGNGEVVYNSTDNVEAERIDFPNTELSGNIEEPKLDINANNNFASIFSRLFLEIKEAFLQVHTFCKETENELAGTQYTCDRKTEILKNAEKAYSYIDRLRKTLDSVLYRETCSGSNNIQSMLTKVGLHKVNDTIIGEYRSTISNCMEQAKVLLDSLDLIKTVMKA